jgi:hypothetical protein
LEIQLLSIQGQRPNFQNIRLGNYVNATLKHIIFKCTFKATHLLTTSLKLSPLSAPLNPRISDNALFSPFLLYIVFFGIIIFQSALLSPVFQIIV